jgi:hypothetical protein
MSGIRKFECPFCHEELSRLGRSCPHCKAGDSGLTEDQVIALRNGVKRYTRIAAIILILAGVSFVIGIAGIFIHMIMAILGFVLWAISLVIVLILLVRGRYFSLILASWGRKNEQVEAPDQN